MQLQNRAINTPQKTFATDAESVEREMILSRVRQQLNGDTFADSHNISSNGIQLLQRAWDILQNDNDKNFISLKLDVLYVLSDTYLQRQAFDKIELYHVPLLELSRQQKDIRKEILALICKAVLLSISSDYKEAMTLFLEAYDKSRSVDARPHAARCLINIGTIYANLFNYDAAQSRYSDVLRDYNDVIDVPTRAAVRLNVGNLFYAGEKYSASLTFLKQGLALAQEFDLSAICAHAHALICRSLLALNHFEEAVVHENAAEDIIGVSSINIPGRSIHFLNVAEIAFKRLQVKQGNYFAIKGIAVARRVNDDSTELRGFALLARAFEKEKQFDSAFRAQKIYAGRQADYLKMQRKMHALDLEIRYSLNEKQRRIEDLLRENEYQSNLLEKTAQIEQQNEQLREINAELQQFAYITAHDLKEPLRMIGSFTQIIQQQYAAQLNPESAAPFRFIGEGVTRMSALLDALLQYAIIGRTNVEPEPVNADEVARIAMTNLKIVIEETVTQISFAQLPVVRASLSLLVQLFQNLISNGIKFRRPDTIPQIVISAEKFNEKQWLFKIKDNGIGIDKQHLDRIFIIFQRLHAREKYEGTGIGLAICQKIIRQFGGKIWVESVLGEGSTFCFTLPVADLQE